MSNSERLAVWKKYILLGGLDLMKMWIVLGRLSYEPEEVNLLIKYSYNCPQNSSEEPTSKIIQITDILRDTAHDKQPRQQSAAHVGTHFGTQQFLKLHCLQ
jgi:hypothetical protein